MHNIFQQRPGIGTARASDLQRPAWTPPREQREAGEWEQCHCDCHRRPGQVKHVIACCTGGWKQTLKGRMNEKKSKQEAAK